MPTIYDITFANAAIELAPVDKRTINNISLLQALFVPFQWIQTLWFDSYFNGSAAPDYTAGVYNIYDRVIYNKVVYESTVSSNTDTPPSPNWMVVQANMVGISERVMYTGQTITLTYALNRWFGTTFRQPNQVPVSDVARASNMATITISAHGYSTGDTITLTGLATTGFNGTWKITGTTTNTFTFANTGADVSTTTDSGISQKLSDIYILTQSNSISIFRSTAADANSSKSFTTGSTEYVFTDFDFTGLVNFNIYVPATTWAAIAATDADRRTLISNFVLNYIPAGITFSSASYT